uniref:Caffeoyl-CoA O-methyltransferase n=1 Tax=Kalanchoe fedtschenkoi TaxID=63787 RepID=A0A7N0VLC0_KALFE
MAPAVTEKMREIANSLTEELPKTLLMNISLHEYIMQPALRREHEQLKALREATEEKYGAWSQMNLPVNEGQFLSMFLKILNPKKTLEIGVFTGYSLLTTAIALPHDSLIVAVDHDKEAYEVGLPFVKQAGVAHKIDFIQSDAVTAMDQMLKNVRDGKMEPFDFIFVDADKPNYKNYHARAVELVKVGGVIAYDNTLWKGLVAKDESQCPECFRPFMKYMIEFNELIEADSRLEFSQLALGDGLTLCRRLV